MWLGVRARLPYHFYYKHQWSGTFKLALVQMLLHQSLFWTVHPIDITSRIHLLLFLHRLDSLNQCPFLLPLHPPSRYLDRLQLLAHHLLQLYLLVLLHRHLFYKLVRLIASLPHGIALDMRQGADGARDRYCRFLQIIGWPLLLQSLHLLHLKFISVHNHQIIVQYQ